tara:strand:- start:11035 stop:11955 length:921 start_codon:yes stop_codon:yes gene_type:complete
MRLIDVSSWAGDDQHEIFPVGARDKKMIWSPSEVVNDGLKCRWPYLFKESISRYPDQFWTEVIAYIISKHLSVEVPLAYPAIYTDCDGQHFGSLIEWFYDEKSENFIHAEQFFKRINPDFDEKLGTQHNLRDLKSICRFLKQRANLQNDILLWLSDIALFDCLIGNTDRHQENWGVIFKPDNTSFLSPLFDNGTSLGHERFPSRVAGWDENRLKQYIDKGQHHLRYVRDKPELRIKLYDLIKMLAGNEKLKTYMLNKITSFDIVAALDEISELTSIECEVPFSKERFDWVSRIISMRFKLIKEVFK